MGEDTDLAERAREAGVRVRGRARGGHVPRRDETTLLGNLARLMALAATCPG